MQKVSQFISLSPSASFSIKPLYVQLVHASEIFFFWFFVLLVPQYNNDNNNNHFFKASVDLANYTWFEWMNVSITFPFFSAASAAARKGWRIQGLNRDLNPDH